jgi:hypothetical protein
MADTSVGKGVWSDENVPLKARVPGLRRLFWALLKAVRLVSGAEYTRPASVRLHHPTWLGPTRTAGASPCMSNFSSSCVSIPHVFLEHGYKDVWKFGRSHKDVLLRCPGRESRNVNYRHSDLLLTLLNVLRYIDHADIVPEVWYKKHVRTSSRERVHRKDGRERHL